MRLTRTLLTAATVLALAACSKPEPEAAPEPVTEAAAPEAAPQATEPAAEAATATATLKPTEGNQVAGELTFTTADGGVHVTGTVTGLTPDSQHGFHIHETGDCSAPDGTSAGGHFNPDGVAHGQVTADPHHAGDTNNITADAQGTATIDQMLSNNVDIGKGDKYDIVGKGVIVHAKPDDYTSQPTGEAGARLACGVIQAGQAPASM